MLAINGQHRTHRPIYIYIYIYILLYQEALPKKFGMTVKEDSIVITQIYDLSGVNIN